MDGGVKPEPIGRSYGSISLSPREELKVFAYQIWKPQLFSVVQFPFDNCHSPFSLTTFFHVFELQIETISVPIILSVMSSSEREDWKIQTRTGNGTPTLNFAMPVQCSTGWAIGPTGNGSLLRVHDKPGESECIYTYLLKTELSMLDF